MGYQFRGLLISLLFLTACGADSTSTNEEVQPKAQAASETDVAGSVSAMNPGDIYLVEFDANGNAAIDFTNSVSTAKYTLIVQSTKQAPSSVGITSKNVSGELPTSFDISLRKKEREQSESGIRPYSGNGLSPSISKTVGDPASFRVITSITGATYTTVNATQKCIRDHIIVYLDNQLPEKALTSSDIETLCDKFEHSAAIEESVFGAVSDVNNDGHVAVLITPEVNKLGASGGGIITGYFYSSDLFPRNLYRPTSNQMEIVYILAPDPEGVYGTAIDKDFAINNYMTAVVPHELQHAISFNQHYFVNGGLTEEDWLNEALSHFAEDYVGFGQENPSRYEGFLAMPEVVPIISGDPNLEERGAEYLFIRYLYEQSADPGSFLASIENTKLTGETNIVAAFAGTNTGFDQWNEFMRRWAVALVLTDTGISSTPEYQYRNRVMDEVTSHWQGVCLVCKADDGRGTVLNGPYMRPLMEGALHLALNGTATAFYSIESPPSMITITGDTMAGLQGVLIRME